MATGDPKTHVFTVPERLVKGPKDLHTWTQSQVRQERKLRQFLVYSGVLF